MKYIDAHLHYLLRKGEEHNLFSNMDKAGVAVSLILPLPPLDFMNVCTAGTSEVYKLYKRHRDRIAFAVFADPRDKKASEIVRRYYDLGAKAFKLYPPLGFWPDAPVCMKLYETLAELKLPVIAHTGATDLTFWKRENRNVLSSHYADPIRFDGLSRAFPEITWVLAHMGFPWSLNAWYVSAANTNVYLDIAGGGFWSTSLPFLYESCGRQIPIDFNRVIWGSDNCLPPDDHITFSKKILSDLGCPKRKHSDVFGKTAASLFDISLC